MFKITLNILGGGGGGYNDSGVQYMASGEVII